jgi:hypothetical protein
METCQSVFQRKTSINSHAQEDHEVQSTPTSRGTSSLKGSESAAVSNHSHINHQAGAALWLLYAAMKPSAACLVSSQAADKESGAAPPAALGLAMEGCRRRGTAADKASTASNTVHIGAEPEDADVSRSRAPRCAVTTSVDTHDISPDLAGPDGKMIADEAMVEEGQKRHVVEEAREQPAAATSSPPWMSFSKGTLSQVLASVQLDLLKVPKQHYQLLEGWAGDSGA